VQLRYQGAAHFHAVLRQHVIAFVSAGPITCRVAGKTLQHKAVEGGLAVFPAGIDTGADCDRDVRSLLIAIDPSRLALASSEDGAPRAQLIERLNGYDENLWRLGQLLADECADGYPRGALFWNETASQLIASLAANYTTGNKPANGVLGGAMLRQIRDSLMAHLDEPIDVATLAGISGRSQFHFSRIFRREVGVSPHRYVVHLRLRRAVELVRDGKLPLAEIAAVTGFADQSHLSRWVKRVHRFRCEAVVAGPAAGSTRSLVTLSRHRLSRHLALQRGPDLILANPLCSHCPGLRWCKCNSLN
jgi:AraC family transcriptional regulator